MIDWFNRRLLYEDEPAEHTIDEARQAALIEGVGTFVCGEQRVRMNVLFVDWRLFPHTYLQV